MAGDLKASSEVLREELAAAFRGEVYGIAFFEHFIAHYEHFETQYQRDVFNLLLKVEQVTADILAEHLPALDVSCDFSDEQKQEGVQDARKWLHKPWPELIDTMVRWVQPYHAKYHEQAQQAGDFLPLFNLVDHHEMAIYQYFLAEQAGEPDAGAILQRFLVKKDKDIHHKK